jgi:mRNA interferase HigB
VRIIATRTIVEAAARHPDARSSLELWVKRVKAANWTSMADVQAGIRTAKIIDRDRARFEIAGGAYRPVVAFDFRAGLVFVKFFGTHAEYDRIDARTVEFES